MTSKKWYSYFVSVEGQEGQGPPPPDDAARAVADIAASLGSAAVNPEQKLAAANVPMPPAAVSAAALAGRPLEFKEIYEAAEIVTPASGYTVMKVAEMLQSPHIKDLPAEVKRSSVLVALDAAGVKVQAIVEDAIRRDKALDAFERIQQKAADEFEMAKLEENRKLQTELDKMAADYKARIQANTGAAAQRKEAFAGWRVQKQIEEQKIADCVAHFVTENPITTSRSAPAAAPVKPL